MARLLEADIAEKRREDKAVVQRGSGESGHQWENVAICFGKEKSNSWRLIGE